MLPQNKNINTSEDDTIMPLQNKLIMIRGDGYCCYHVMLLHLLLIVRGRDSLIQATSDTIGQLGDLGTITPDNVKEFLGKLDKFPEAYQALLDRITSPEYLQKTKKDKCVVLDDRLLTIQAKLVKQQQFLSQIEETPLISTMLSLLDADITSLSNQAAPILSTYFTSSQAGQAPELDNSYKKIFLAFLQALNDKNNPEDIESYGAQFPNALAFLLKHPDPSWPSLEVRYWGTDGDLAIYRKCFFEAIEDPTDYLGYEMIIPGSSSTDYLGHEMRISGTHFNAIFKVVGNKPSALLQTMQANLTEQDICSLVSQDNTQIGYIDSNLKHHSLEDTISHKINTSPSTKEDTNPRKKNTSYSTKKDTNPRKTNTSYSTTPKKTEAINAALDDNNASLRKQIKKDYIAKVAEILNKFIITYNKNRNTSDKSIKDYIEKFKKEYKSIKQFDEAGNLTRKQLDDIITRCENLNQNIRLVASGKGPKNSL